MKESWFVSLALSSYIVLGTVSLIVRFFERDAFARYKSRRAEKYEVNPHL